MKTSGCTSQDGMNWRHQVKFLRTKRCWQKWHFWYYCLFCALMKANKTEIFLALLNAQNKSRRLRVQFDNSSVVVYIFYGCTLCTFKYFDTFHISVNCIVLSRKSDHLRTYTLTFPFLVEHRKIWDGKSWYQPRWRWLAQRYQPSWGGTNHSVSKESWERWKLHQHYPAAGIGKICNMFWHGAW